MSNTLKPVIPCPRRCPRECAKAVAENDNLRNEYHCLFADVPKDIAFARIALGQEADAINMWIGNQRSTTAMHKDNDENIYVQVRGQKHFTLMSPVEMPCVNEQRLQRARYEPEAPEEDVGENNALKIELGDEGETVPVATWDPDSPGLCQTEYSCLAKPLRVTLDEGDMLYLPAMSVSLSPHRDVSSSIADGEAGGTTRCSRQRVKKALRVRSTTGMTWILRAGSGRRIAS